MSITILHNYFPEWDALPIKFKDIVEDVSALCKRHCQEPMIIVNIEKKDNEWIFFCSKLPKCGSNGILRLLEITNEIYQFDPKREKIPFAEVINTGFLFRCCWETHSLNKKYKKEAMNVYSI